ncbi:unnamed protein product [Cuscuta europaea]|uniref:CGL160/ATPI domain-containing protein n=1 Tax=Cuscuta europaea TaxID=41803 RepID=A0A9P0YY65_CUSEU|nr:unnamed protein product [Cuscuta europaea]
MAALNCYLSVTAVTTPISQPALEQKQPKIILPKKSEKLPPSTTTTTKRRKFWGVDEDPLTSDDFIWNKEFMGHMKNFIQDPSENGCNAPAIGSKEDTSGFLSINRVLNLDSLEVDLSKELLTSPSKSLLGERAQETQDLQNGNHTYHRWRPTPTSHEQEKWGKATKAAIGGSDVMLRELRRPNGDPKVMAAQSIEEYLKLKNKLQLLTLGVGSIGVLSAYVSYSPEIAASYGVGLLGSLAYMRMLGNSVDSIQPQGPRAIIKGAIGQPRLLVPLVLVMIYNRWNRIVVPEYGLVHLELIPMLVGFFTYKMATFIQAIDDVMSVGKKTRQL